ncbi:reverse transcriptase domain-containing protein [Tanacetum coccineum]
MSERAELNLTPPTSAMRNTVGKGKGQTSRNSDRPAFDAALREYCDKHHHQLLLIIVEKVHQEKMQQEKLKEVKARLNFEGCSKRNSKGQEVSQHSESRTPNIRGEHRKDEDPNALEKEERTEEYSISWEIKEIVCPHTQKAVTRVTTQKEQNPFPENFTMREHVPGGQKYSPRPWVCEEIDPFMARIRYFDLLKKTRMPNNVKTYDGSDDPEDHLKIVQTAAKVEQWAIPTWCHMFNSTLTGSARVWFDDLPPESIDSYDDLKKAFLVNFLQRKKCIKDPVEIHHIKQRDGESTEDFVQRFKTKSRHVKGAPECIRIFGFMHEITNPGLIKRLHDNIPKSVDKVMRVTTAFLRGEGAASNQARKKALLTRKAVAPNQGDKARRRKRSAKIGKKRDVRQGQSYGNPDGPTVAEGSQAEDHVKFLLRSRNFIPTLRGEDRTEGPIINEAGMRCHFIHRMYVDGGSSSEILYEHCFNRLRPKIKSQMVSATVPLVGFSGEIIWPMGQISLLVKIGDEEHFTSAWMNFMVGSAAATVENTCKFRILKNLLDKDNA